MSDAVLRFQHEPDVVLRFRRSERWFHWSIAAPFVICAATGFVLMAFYNLHSEGWSRATLSWIHRISGICFAVSPAMSAAVHWRDLRIHWSNVKEALRWSMQDSKWLSAMGLRLFDGRIRLPEQGKFNAAEKLNFLMVMCTYPLFIVTGLLLLMPGTKFISWITHVTIAVSAAPLMLGHIYMALINPETRVGISGMLSGYVDRAWAKHHYGRWYRENFESRRGPASSVGTRRGDCVLGIL